MTACPCGSGLSFSDCCKPLHDGKPAATAEALMRSRYSAFAVGNMAYLDKTCTPEMRGDADSPAEKRAADATPRWLGLKILRVVDGGVDDETGQVEFAVEYELGKKKHSRHELSDFRRINGAWTFTASEYNPGRGTVVREGEKTGRNDPCPCGSQKKFKKCCGA